MSSRFFFPDNTVLITFALAGREDLLVLLLKEQVQWTVTIAAECHRSSLEPGLEGMSTYIAEFREPLTPSPSERVDTRVYRDRLALPGDPDVKHLGEAETIAVVTSRGIPAIFVTDDNGARELAAAAGVQTATTMDLFRTAVRVGLLSQDALWAIFQLLKERKRRLYGAPQSITQLETWLG